jgi:hypothetical protein
VRTQITTVIVTTPCKAKTLSISSAAALYLGCNVTTDVVCICTAMDTYAIYEHGATAPCCNRTTGMDVTTTNYSGHTYPLQTGQ